MYKHPDLVHVVSAHFNFLPYHAARYAAFIRHSGSSHRLTAFLVCPTHDYRLHDQSCSLQQGFAVVRNVDDKRSGAHAKDLGRRLDELRPDVLLLLGGYAAAGMLSVVRYGVQRGIPMILCSETKVDDKNRSRGVELLKRRIIGLFSSALVGGIPHAQYLVRLGMPQDHLFRGYDAVDNEYFYEKTEEIRCRRSEVRCAYGLPQCYFLASARFVEKKNLPRLIHAYALYRRMAEHGRQKAGGTTPTSEPWSLVLLGDGPLRSDLCRLISDLRLQAFVTLPGFKQYPDLPAHYGLASSFVHASTTEPWGLVVNEAMASGLPVLVSNRCGCAADLIQDGVNGFTFDPYNIEQLAQLMLKLSTFHHFRLSAFGDASRRIIANWGPERFAANLKAAVEKALEVGANKATLLDRILLAALSARWNRKMT